VRRRTTSFEPSAHPTMRRRRGRLRVGLGAPRQARRAVQGLVADRATARTDGQACGSPCAARLVFEGFAPRLRPLSAVCQDPGVKWPCDRLSPQPNARCRHAYAAIGCLDSRSRPRPATNRSSRPLNPLRGRLLCCPSARRRRRADARIVVLRPDGQTVDMSQSTQLPPDSTDHESSAFEHRTPRLRSPTRRRMTSPATRDNLQGEIDAIALYSLAAGEGE